MTDSPSSVDDASARPHPSSRPVVVDVQALGEWLMTGLSLFIRGTPELPSRRATEDAALRVVLVAALRRQGSIAGAARALGTSRRAVRAAMQRWGLYDDWRQEAGVRDEERQ